MPTFQPVPQVSIPNIESQDDGHTQSNDLPHSLLHPHPHPQLRDGGDSVQQLGPVVAGVAGVDGVDGDLQVIGLNVFLLPSHPSKY